MHDAAAKMIDAAEQLVAEHGMAALTVQAVQRAAGQRNKSAVAYHFGDRQGLINALIAHRTAPTNERRTAMLLDLPADAPMRSLVEVLVVPLAESVLQRTPSHWARFLLQAISDPATALAALDTMSDQAFELVQSRLADRLDHLPEPLRTLRVQGAFGYACVILAAFEIGVLPPQFSPDALITELVDACCGLVAAPSTATIDAPAGA